MTQVPRVVVYDRVMPRRMLYVHHVHKRVPVTVLSTSSISQVGTLAQGVDMVILSVVDHVEAVQAIAALHEHTAVPVVVIEPSVYSESEYRSVVLRGHFVRTEHRISSMFDSITSILKQ